MTDERSLGWRAPAVIVSLLGVIATVVVAVITRDGSGGAAEAPHVVDVSLDARTREFYLRCPTTLFFDGSISVDAGHGQVGYQFVYRSDLDGPETREPVRSVRVDGPSSTPVRYTWTPTIPQGDVFRTVVLEVISPVTRRSSEVTIRGRCDANLPAGPDVPPPDVPGAPPGG